MSDDSNRAKILIVDDTTKNLQYLGTILRNEGYDVIIAQSGVQAMKSIGVLLPDLILLDVMMPEMDGYTLCRHLKEDTDTAQIPVIFLTAKTESNDVVQGFEVGAVDYVTKPFNSSELLSRVHTHLELRRSYQIIEQQRQEMVSELEQARQTQLSSLPAEFPKVAQVRFAHKYFPMEQIGGDFYNVFLLEEGDMGLLVADVTGHGVSAALTSFMVSGVFNNCVGAGEPEIVVRLTNGYLEGKLQEGKFATMFYLVYHTQTKIITYTSAGHPPAFVIRPSSQELFELNTRGFPVGVFDRKFAEYGEGSFQLEPADKVFAYTDGIIEIPDENSDVHGINILKDFLIENAHLPIGELIENAFDFAQNLAGAQGFADDITLLGFEIDSAAL